VVTIKKGRKDKKNAVETTGKAASAEKKNRQQNEMGSAWLLHPKKGSGSGRQLKTIRLTKVESTATAAACTLHNDSGFAGMFGCRVAGLLGCRAATA